MGLCIVHTDTYRGQKRALDPPELELQVVESYTMGTVGTEFESSIRAASSYPCTISPATENIFPYVT